MENHERWARIPGIVGLGIPQVELPVLAKEETLIPFLDFPGLVWSCPGEVPESHPMLRKTASRQVHVSRLRHAARREAGGEEWMKYTVGPIQLKSVVTRVTKGWQCCQDHGLCSHRPNPSQSESK